MSNEKEEIEKIDRLERIYLTWVTNAAIFIAVAPIMRNMGKNGKIYSLMLFTIAITLFTVTNIDYLGERKKLTNDNIRIPLRLDLLFAIIIVTIIVIAIIIYDYSINDVNISTNLIKKITNIFGVEIKNGKVKL